MKPYIAITPYKVGTYGWAMDQLAAGNQVRRFDWPIEVEENGVRIWRVYKISPTTMCKGFNPGVSGADNDSWGDLGTDSMCYYPSQNDLVATDWQTVDSITKQQIDFLNTHRMVRTPNMDVIAYDLRMARSKDAWWRVFFIAVWSLVGAIGVLILWWHNV